MQKCAGTAPGRIAIIHFQFDTSAVLGAFPIILTFSRREQEEPLRRGSSDYAGRESKREDPANGGRGLG